MARKKFRINLTVEIDQDSWAADSGINVSDVRADLKTTAAQVVWDHLDRLGYSPDVREV